MTALSLALIAHDAKKAELAEWVARQGDNLKRWSVICTENTANTISKTNPALNLVRVKSGTLGGDQQIGALIATGKIAALIFFPDPLTAMPHDVDVRALLRLAIIYNIPCALNVASADLMFKPPVGNLYRAPARCVDNRDGE